MLGEQRNVSEIECLLDFIVETISAMQENAQIESHGVEALVEKAHAMVGSTDVNDLGPATKASTTRIEEVERSDPCGANLHTVSSKSDEQNLIAKVKYITKYDNVYILESGEIVALPPFWTVHESKSRNGLKYYASKTGHTQWHRPPVKTGINYQFELEIEVTLNTEQLGLNLKQVSSEPGCVFTDIPVFVAEIYKFPSGMASCAELYNWSVKADKRIRVGMRLTAIDGFSLVGFSFTEVIERLRHAPRPLRIRFADITTGVKGRSKENTIIAESSIEKTKNETIGKQNLVKSWYLKIMIMLELKLEIWKIQEEYIQQMQRITAYKHRDLLIGAHSEKVNAERLRGELRDLDTETSLLQDQISNLSRQAEGVVESEELTRWILLREKNEILEREVWSGLDEITYHKEEHKMLHERFQHMELEVAALKGKGSNHELPVSQRIAEIGEEGYTKDIFEISGCSSTQIEENIKLTQSSCEKEQEKANLIRAEIKELKQKLVDVDAIDHHGVRYSALNAAESRTRNTEMTLCLLMKTIGETSPSLINDTDLSLATPELPEDEAVSLTESRTHQRGMSSPFIPLSALWNDVHGNDQTDKVIENEVWDSVHRSSIHGHDKDDKSALMSTCRQSSVPVVRKTSERRQNTDVEGLEIARMSDEAIKKHEHDHEHDQIREVQSTSDPLCLEPNIANLGSKESLMVNLIDCNETKSAFDAKESKSSHFVARPMIHAQDSVGSILSDLQQKTREQPLISYYSKETGDLDAYQSDSDEKAQNHQENLEEKNIELAIELTGPVPTRQRIACDQSRNHVKRVKSHPEGSSSNVKISNRCGILQKQRTLYQDKGVFKKISLRGALERWCKIDRSGVLLYYKREGDRNPRGRIELSDPTVEVTYEEMNPTSLNFTISTTSKQVRFLTKDRADLIGWVEALQTTLSYFSHIRSSILSPEALDHTDTVDSENLRATLGF